MDVGVCGLLVGLAIVALVIATGLAVGVPTDDDVVIGEPDITVLAPEHELVPGEETTLELQLNNRGDMQFGGEPELEETVLTAETTKMTVVDEDAPLTDKTGTKAIGTVREGSDGPYEFTVVPDEDAEPGVYDVEVEFDYQHSYRAEFEDGSVETNDRQRTETTTVELEIADRSRFAVVDTTTDALVGQSGTVELTLENIGGDTARETSVYATSPDSGLSFRSGAEDTDRFEGDWEPGETRTLEYAIDVDDVEARPFLVELELSFWDDLGVEQTSRTVPTGVTPGSAQEFTLDARESSLEVGTDGSADVQVRNRGPDDVENAVLVFEDDEDDLGQELGVDASDVDAASLEDPNVLFRDPLRSVGDLTRGDARTVSFTADVRSDAEPGERTVSAAVRYRAPNGEAYLSDPVDLTVDVAPERDQFAVEAVNETVPADADEPFLVEVTNTGGETVTDVEASLFADSPLDSDDDEAYVPDLAPNETTTLRFDLTVDGDADRKYYAVSVDFRYDDVDGDSHLSDTYRIPVEPDADDDGDGAATPGLLGGLTILALVVFGAAVWQRDRLNQRIDELETDRFRRPGLTARFRTGTDTDDGDAEPPQVTDDARVDTEYDRSGIRTYGPGE